MDARIWIADLAAYNAGSIHGKWVELDGDDDETKVEAAIEELKATSPVPDPEEFVCHDHEGTGVRSECIAEHVAAVAVLAALEAEGHDEETAAAIVSAAHDCGASDILDWASDCYAGTARTLADFVESHYEDCGDMRDVPAWCRNHIDWESIANDWQCGGDVFTSAGGEGVYVFWNR